MGQATVRIPAKKRVEWCARERRNHFRTYFYWTFFFCLAGGAEYRGKKGCVHPTRVCVRQKGCTSLANPFFFATMFEAFPFSWAEQKNEREKERVLLIDDALILRKERSGFIDAGRISEPRSIPLVSKGNGGKAEQQGTKKRRGKPGPFNTSSIDAAPISLKSVHTAQRNCDGGHEQGQ